jgi:peptidyl-prolyl cis-trans isomerase SurA
MPERNEYLGREMLIAEKTIGQAARRQGIQVVVTDQQIEAEGATMDEWFKSNGFSLAEYMNKTGMTSAQLREEIRRQIEKDALMDKLLGLQPPTDREIRAYYGRHQERYTVPSAVRVSEILVAFPQGHPPTRQQRQALREKADGLRLRLLKGENFATLARAVSNGSSAREGGDLGWVPQDLPIPRPLHQAIFALEEGKVGPVFEDGEGYRLLLVTDWSKARVAPFDQIRPIVERDLLEARRADKAPALLKKIRKEAKVVEY